MNKLIIVSGPTATGKTKTSIEIALKIQNEFKIPAVIVNFDSLLFYKEISIGTAKPSVEERKNIPHFMIDIASIKSPMNAALFIRMGEQIIKEQMEKGHLVILVGGSAFYLRALLKGMYESATPDEEMKEHFEKKLAENGIDSIIAYLNEHDPASLKNYHHNDHYRLTRAAIHFASTGTKISEQKTVLDEKSPYDFSEIIHPWDVLHLYLDIPKDEHFNIIKNRTAKMFTDGLLAEITALEAQGFSLLEKPLSSIGYKEAILFKRGEIHSLDECIERISISTRQLAKSQRTFFKKISPKEVFNPLDSGDKIFSSVEQFLKKC